MTAQFVQGDDWPEAIGILVEMPDPPDDLVPVLWVDPAGNFDFEMTDAELRPLTPDQVDPDLRSILVEYEPAYRD